MAEVNCLSVHYDRVVRVLERIEAMSSIAMKIAATGVWVAVLGIGSVGIIFAQPAPTTIDGYLSAAKDAAGTEWAGTLLRLCIPPPAGTQRGGGGARTPARETGYAEPAKVAD